MPAYRSNRRRALLTRALVVLGTVLLAFPFLVLALSDFAAGAIAASQGTDAYRAMSPSVNSWRLYLALVVAAGIVATALAGTALTFWLTRSAANLHVLPVPDVRLPSGLLTAPPILLTPALVWAFSWLRLTYPQASALNVALTVAAAMSLTLPFVVIRRLWVASSIQGADGSAPPVWGGVLIWWSAYAAGWTAWGLYLVRPVPTWNNHLGVVSFYILSGLLELALAAAVVIAAIFIIRIMFRINAMQDALTRALPQPAARSERRAIAPVRSAAAQWQCESCEVMNPTALRFCQNCASERR